MTEQTTTECVMDFNYFHLDGQSNQNIGVKMSEEKYKNMG